MFACTPYEGHWGCFQLNLASWSFLKSSPNNLYLSHIVIVSYCSFFKSPTRRKLQRLPVFACTLLDRDQYSGSEAAELQMARCEVYKRAYIKSLHIKSERSNTPLNTFPLAFSAPKSKNGAVMTKPGFHLAEQKSICQLWRHRGQAVTVTMWKVMHIGALWCPLFVLCCTVHTKRCWTQRVVSSSLHHLVFLCRAPIHTEGLHQEEDSKELVGCFFLYVCK